MNQERIKAMKSKSKAKKTKTYKYDFSFNFRVYEYPTHGGFGIHDLGQHSVFMLLTEYPPGSENKRQLLKFYVSNLSDSVVINIDGEFHVRKTKEDARALWNRSIADGARMIYPPLI